MNKTAWRIRIVALIVAGALIGACTSVPDKGEQIAELMERYDELGRFNGTVLVAQNGEVIYAAGLGYAIFEWEILNTPDTRLRIASITKQFTSLLVLQEVAAGNMALDATIDSYVPEYPQPNGSTITIHQLLSHTSGMPHYRAIPDFFPRNSRQPYTPEQYMHLFWELDLLSEPGSRYSYSSFGYYLLGVILERVTGRSYGELLAERIFEPLGMHGTGLEDHLTLEPRRAAGYDRTYFEGYRNAEFRDLSTAFSTGALYSTVEDLHLWDRALYTDQLLESEYKALLFRPNIQGYGYGWRISRRPGLGTDSVDVVNHSGGTNGFNSLLTRVLDDQYLIVLLRNSTGNGHASLRRITDRIADLLYDRPIEQPQPSAALLLGETIREQGIESALSAYQARAAEYDLAEDEINVLGYELLNLDLVAEAIEIFKLNVAAFPQSANVHDSLGEAYLAAGRREEAVASYREALELDPEYPNAPEALAQLEAANP
ncbi:MAG: serine hydrolase [Candidatus Neomarinimicrobiota bacterium]